MRARFALTAAAVLGLGLCLGACKGAPPTIGDPPPQLENAAEEAAYQDVLKRYSGQAQIYSKFDTHLFSGATFQTWPFREAKVRRIAQFKAMTKPEEEALLSKEREQHEQFHVFELGTWTENPTFDDFDRKDSIWRIALLVDGTTALPVEVVRTGRVNQNTRAIYPYMGQFWVGYQVRFPKTRPDGAPLIPPGTREVVLQVASTLGKAELRAAAE